MGYPQTSGHPHEQAHFQHDAACTSRKAVVPVARAQHLPAPASAGATGAGLVQVARERAAAAAGSDAAGSGGADFGGEATVLVGDTPLDVAAALATGARAVGVATGNFTEQELIAAGAHAVLPDRSDTARVRAAVLGSWAEGRAAS